MMGRDIRIRSREGPLFDCYLAMPEGTHAVPGVVLASAIHGVDADIRGIADDFASRGFMAAAPDLFWRKLPGPLSRGDSRAAARSQPRLEMIATGEQDLIDVLQALKRESRFDGRAMVAGFCYGGPYAIVGPKRLGYQAGVSFHGTQMADYVDDLEGLSDPVCVVWGDDDYLAPPAVLNAYIAVAARNKTVAVHVRPGVKHGFMMRSNEAAFDSESYDFSIDCAVKLLR